MKRKKVYIQVLETCWGNKVFNKPRWNNLKAYQTIEEAELSIRERKVNGATAEFRIKADDGIHYIK